ncbi:sulfite exporter TauE/SafE family protein [Streptomonospora sp. PA3]|uniref:sulfite exporter TauE/SafE family protein n=1 Tax=Streptomonospora sp. PA3 TaxID=2607326 RepID=UPI0012DFDDCD|nr:sulfite exporter TauE/SafE family protein [Streptomonospora sp. PA3]MUL42290.1 sulfite exporter TauE/SafE family protein [Streptomonospora sp. PA3]
MQTLVLLGFVGLLAQLINGSLGMGYGISTTSALLAIGTAPALASATVNLSQVGSQIASGFAHWRFGNVDWAVVWRIAVPGALGAFVGAVFLSRLSTEAAGPLMSTILLILGGYLLARFTFRELPHPDLSRPLRAGFLAPVGLFAGFMNSTGGGGWGPVGTSALLASGRLEPRKVIGSISVGESAVVIAGSIGFALGLGLGGIKITWVAVLLLGGLLAAPLAAWLASRVPARMLGSTVGGLIIFTNTRVLLTSDAVGASAGVSLAVYILVALVWAGAVAWSLRAHFAERRERRLAATAPEHFAAAQAAD